MFQHKEISIETHIINQAYGIGNRIEGYSKLIINKRVVITDLHFNLIGEVTLSHNFHHKQAIKEVREFYKSPDIPAVPEQTCFTTLPFCREYYPGTYNIPFSFQVPNVPHPTVHIQGGIGSSYRVQCTVEIRHTVKHSQDIMEAKKHATFTGSTEAYILYKMGESFSAAPKTNQVSENLVLAKLICQSGVKPNEPVKVNIVISNNTGKPIKPIVTWYTEHNYRETCFCNRGGIKELEEESGKLFQKEILIDTTQLLPTIKHGDFILESFVEMIIKLKKKSSVCLKVPITVGWSKVTTIGNKARADLMGIPYPGTQYKYFGSHFRPSPKCPPVIEKFVTEGNDEVYVNHLWRRVYLDEKCTKLLNIRYPMPECEKLPKGWGIGMDRGEMYFINYNKQITSWADPRSLEQRRSKVEGIEITIKEGKNFPTIKGKELQFVAQIIDANQMIIKTCQSTKGIHPKWIDTPGSHDKPTIRVMLENNRENIIIGFYTMGKLYGAVDIPTWRIATNGVEQWYQLHNFGDFSIPQIGEVLIRIQRIGDVKSTQEEKIKMRFKPYYINSAATKDQEIQYAKMAINAGKTIKFETTGDDMTTKKGTLTENGYSEAMMIQGTAEEYNVRAMIGGAPEEKFDIPKQRFYDPNNTYEEEDVVEKKDEIEEFEKRKVEIEEERKMDKKLSIEERLQKRKDRFNEIKQRVERITNETDEKKQIIEQKRKEIEEIEMIMKEYITQTEDFQLQSIAIDDEISTLQAEMSELIDENNDVLVSNIKMKIEEKETEKKTIEANMKSQQNNSLEKKKKKTAIENEIFDMVQQIETIEIILFTIQEYKEILEEDLKKSIEEQRNETLRLEKIASEKKMEEEKEQRRIEELERRKKEEEEMLKMLQEDEERRKEMQRKAEEEEKQRQIELERKKREDEIRLKKEEKKRLREEHDRRKVERAQERKRREAERERKRKEEESKAASFGVVDQMQLSNSEKELLGLI